MFSEIFAAARHRPPLATARKARDPRDPDTDRRRASRPPAPSTKTHELDPDTRRAPRWPPPFKVRNRLPPRNPPKPDMPSPYRDMKRLRWHTRRQGSPEESIGLEEWDGAQPSPYRDMKRLRWQG